MIHRLVSQMNAERAPSARRRHRCQSRIPKGLWSTAEMHWVDFFSSSQRSSPSVYRFHIFPVFSRKRNCRDVSQKVNQSKLNPGSKSRSTLSFCGRSRFRKGRRRKKYLRRKRAESFSLHEKGKQKSDHYNRSWLLPVCRRAKRSLQGSSNEGTANNLHNQC